MIPFRDALGGLAPALASAGATASTLDDDQKLLTKYERCKKEAFDGRQIYERIWLRNLYYRLGRQWLTYASHPGEWRDTKLARGVPKPISTKPAEIERTIRSMFAGINIGINARPNGRDPRNVVMAGLVDDLIPILRDVHDLPQVLNEFDFWFIITGNAFLHSWLDHDPKYGVLHIPYERCLTCGTELLSSQIAERKGVCPTCGGSAFAPTDRVEAQPQSRAVTTPLSPLELAFPLHHARWADVPYLIRMRWRDKAYYENHPELRTYVDRIAWAHAPTDRSLTIFKSLPFHSELGGLHRGWSTIPGGDNHTEGVAEYELWYRPCHEYPDGLVARFAGESSPLVLHVESEGLPGPLPYRTQADQPLFTFTHAAYEHVGGRVLGTGALDPVIGRIDQVNRLDSLIEMHATRTTNPVWMLPKGAEVAWLGDSPGLPGLILEWNALAAGGTAKPTREAGIPIDQSLIAWRERLLTEIEAAAGTLDILKGVKPAGTEAFSALQLLVERAQSVFASAFQARGLAHRDWAHFALELERSYGPDERTQAVLTPARGYIFREFQRADLQGEVHLVIEDGTHTPKTALGRRAAIEHAHQLRMFDAANPETQYAILTELGLTSLVPGLDHHVQAALNKQQAFETWLEQNGPALVPPGIPPTDLPTYPLRWRPWYDPAIHKAECLKWANSDRMQEWFRQSPALEGLITAHLLEIDLALSQQAAGQLPRGVAGAGAPPPGGSPPPGTAPPPAGAAPAGAARALRNSNQNSAPVGNTPQPPQGV
jgi:hypothetical protein